MLSVLSIAGAVALILYGIRSLRKGLERLFGSRLGWWMQRLATHRFRAFLAGLLVSVPAPSSTTITVLSVEAVQAGHLTLRQSLAVLLGSNIGLTATVFLISLNLDAYAPLLLLVGVGLFQFTKGSRPRGIGQVMLSLGLIFLAVFLIRQNVADVMTQAGPESDLIKLIQIAERHPLWLAGIAAVLTIALQSSTASIGLVIGLVAGGIDSVAIALPAVLGANIGLSVTMVFFGWQRVESRRMAMGNLLLKAAVAIPLVAAQSWVVMWVQAMPGDTTRHVAVMHTGFNVLVALVGLPLLGQTASLMKRLIPEPTESQAKPFGPRYIHRSPGDVPALALGQSQREIVRVSEIVREMLDDLWVALKTNDQAKARAVSQRDDEVDLLDAHIKRYLAQLGSEVDEVANSREQINQLTYLTELENIGDIIDQNLSELVIKKIRLQVDFSPEGWKELDDFYQKVAQNLLIADTAFTTRDRLLAQQLLRHKEYLNNYERELRDRHFARLNLRRAQTHETTAIHLDILTHLKRINSGASHVGYAILQSDETGTTA